LESIDGTLAANAYTRAYYNAAKGFSTAAYKFSEPLQVKLAPLIITADGLANRAVDAVESRYPYPFKAQPNDIVTGAHNLVSSRIDEANKALDEKIKNPALSVAHDLDQRMAPLLDYFEKTVASLTHRDEPGPSAPDAQYQYQRALALSRTLKDSVYEYSAEQLNHIRAQSVVIQRATEASSSINSIASSSFANASSGVHSLSEAMLGELLKIQQQTSALASSIQDTMHSSKSQIQTQLAPQIRHTYVEISSALSSSISELSGILTQKETPWEQKANLIRQEVGERVHPLLDTVKKGFADILARGKDVLHTPPRSPTTVTPAGSDGSESPNQVEQDTKPEVAAPPTAA